MSERETVGERGRKSEKKRVRVRVRESAPATPANFRPDIVWNLANNRLVGTVRAPQVYPGLVGFGRCKFSPSGTAQPHIQLVPPIHIPNHTSMGRDYCRSSTCTAGAM